MQKVEDHRRKWDRDEYERIARDRLEEETQAALKSDKKEPPPKRELLKPRDYRVCILQIVNVTVPCDILKSTILTVLYKFK